LRYGSTISTLVMIFGLGLLFLRGLPPSIPAVKGIHAGELFAKIARLDAAAVMELGILLLLLTPVLRIIMAAVSFVLEREYKYFLISLGVLAVVLLSISFAMGG
jgi:uncharacterized membrane protein